MTNKLILTDVDGVKLDWDKQFSAWMHDQGYSGLVDEGNYDLSIRYGIDGKTIDRLVKQFNTSAAVGFCEPYAKADVYVKKLADLGYRFHAITSMGGDKYSRTLRERNLTEHFGDVYDQITFLDLQDCKRAELSKYAGSGLWWIEDKLENALVGLELGLRPILMSAPHNEHYDGGEIIIADDWRDVYDIISGAGEDL